MKNASRWWFVLDRSMAHHAILVNINYFITCKKKQKIVCAVLSKIFDFSHPSPSDYISGIIKINIICLLNIV